MATVGSGGFSARVGGWAGTDQVGTALRWRCGGADRPRTGPSSRLAARHGAPVPVAVAPRGSRSGAIQRTARANARRRLSSSIARAVFLWPSMRRIEIAKLLNAASTFGLVALPRPAGVLARLAVAHPVHPVLDRSPIAARQFRQLLRPGVLLVAGSSRAHPGSPALPRSRRYPP